MKPPAVHAGVTWLSWCKNANVPATAAAEWPSVPVSGPGSRVFVGSHGAMKGWRVVCRRAQPRAACRQPPQGTGEEESESEAERGPLGPSEIAKGGFRSERSSESEKILVFLITIYFRFSTLEHQGFY